MSGKSLKRESSDNESDTGGAPVADVNAGADGVAAAGSEAAGARADMADGNGVRKAPGERERRCRWASRSARRRESTKARKLARRCCAGWGGRGHWSGARIGRGGRLGCACVCMCVRGGAGAAHKRQGSAA